MSSAKHVIPGRIDSCESLKAAAAAQDVELRAWARGSYPGIPLPADDLQEIRSVGVWDARKTQHWGLDWHTNEGLELSYLSRGRLPFSTGNDRHHLSRGAMTITRPWQPHRLGDPWVPPSRLTWVILDVGVRRPDQMWRWPDWLLLGQADRQRLTTLLSHNEQLVFTADRRSAAAFEALATMLASGTPGTSAARLKLAINEILMATLGFLDAQDLVLDPTLCDKQRLVQLFLDDLSQRLDEPWTLDSMALACGLGRTRFAHYCRLLTNRNPAQALNRMRLEAAKALLWSDPGRSVTDIALSCGFGTSQYFATCFRAEIGCTPKEFRAQKPL